VVVVETGGRPVVVGGDPSETEAMSASDRDTVLAKHKALVAELTESGELLDGAGLDYPRTATTLRSNRGDPVTAEGPFVETREQLTAYYVVDCASLERAGELVRRVLDFHVTAVEVRRIHT
jgi:hypothetical protein